MSITPKSPAISQQGWVQTWVTSQWKNPSIPGQFSAEINKTASGVTRFKISNPRENTVLDHVQITNEVLKRQDAERRETERRKRKSTEHKGASGVKEIYTPGAEGVKEIWGTGYKNLMTTTYSEYVEDLGTEERDNPLKVSTGLPYPVPASEEELTAMLADLFAGCRLSPQLMIAMRKMLMAGTLTPKFVDQQRRFAS